MKNTNIILPSRISPLVKLNRFLSQPSFDGAHFYIVLDENTYNCCLPQLISRVAALENAEFFEVPVGEDAKSLEVAAGIWSSLVESNADKNAVIINLGGGTISDLGGFVAASFKRGLRYVNIPTTLIAMVDAAIGGKTALNMCGAKNQVGFFHLPSAVCVDPLFLTTLPDDHVVSGMFEIIKTLFLSGSNLLQSFIEDTLSAVSISKFDFSTYIEHCVRFKSSVVKSDLYDLSVRKMLNLGHTVGHAIESFMAANGESVSHGVAVSLGLWCALYLSVNKLSLPIAVLERYRDWLNHWISIPHFTLRDTEEILSFMRHDKKCAEGQILFVLLQEVGVPVIDVVVSENEIRDAILKLSK